MRLIKRIEAKYTGYVLQNYYRSYLTPDDIRELYTKLKRIPPKISAFIDRSTIAEAFKYTKWIYLIIDTDGNTFVINY